MFRLAGHKNRNAVELRVLCLSATRGRLQRRRQWDRRGSIITSGDGVEGAEHGAKELGMRHRFLSCVDVRTPSIYMLEILKPSQQCQKTNDAAAGPQSKTVVEA